VSAKHLIESLGGGSRRCSRDETGALAFAAGEEFFTGDQVVSWAFSFFPLLFATLFLSHRFLRFHGLTHAISRRGGLPDAGGSVT
jgi:hypothetical protein